jgi:glutamate dehydrogenase
MRNGHSRRVRRTALRRASMCLPHQEIRLPFEQIDREKVGSARNPIATIVRHVATLPDWVFVGRMPAGRSAISQPIEMAEPPVGVPPYAGFIVTHQGDLIQVESEQWRRTAFDLRRLPHLDERVFALADCITGGDLLSAELLLALSHLAHQKLVSKGALLYSRDRINDNLIRYPQLAIAVTDCFRQRFTLQVTPQANDCEQMRATIRRDTESDDARTLFETLVDEVHATVRTNLLLPERRALALRIDPAFLTAEGRDELPFGVFFVCGSQFDGFHVRFRDIARGGVRIVRPTGQEQYALETERHYGEAYGLAYAQQQKNKDIPEGGSKAVVLATPEADFEQVGRAFADALLDLVIPDAQLHALHVDHFGANELLYLGPDENISNRLIGWIVERARQRGHPMPDAFMSSKPTAGINHKEYGVTSEGITVFLEHALRAVGINPRNQPFTVKMTGGPDGDVAGNEILILHRELGSNVRILGIADGSGIAEDPAGLDMAELTRLVKSALPISSFDPDRLGSNGRVVGIDQPGGVNLRNTLHNRILADAFIPGGGRPNTMNDTNWWAFLDQDGNPSARVIVEGANLFLSPQVRTHLSEKGVVIIKDSSANKCGVICSSYEIIASMLLDEQTFLDLKPRFVDEVLAKLRALAGLEARTLFRERLHKPSIHLPELSERLSRAINHATDAIADSITSLQGAHPQLVRQLVVRYLPPSLLERSGEQTFERIPAAYLNRVIASSLASRIVYREGLDWLESMPAEAVAKLAERYLVEEARVHALACEVRSSTLQHRERIAMLLETGGVAAALRAQAD